jgi:SAM-dependent methyltransferase
MMFFDQYKEFVDSDIRKDRPLTRVTSESLSKRCQALLPSWLIKDKTVLDLGHCYGAFGQWCLANGAKHYTGVDIQKLFCDKSKELLSKYWSDEQFSIEQEDVLAFLQKTPSQKYDIIVVSGVMHCYSNPISFVESVCNSANEVVIIETLEADESNGVPSIQFKIFNMVSDDINSPYQGWTALVGYNALRSIMEENNFEIYGQRIFPEKIENSHDAYNDDITAVSPLKSKPNRYMVRYKRTRRKIKKSLQYNILNNVHSRNTAYVGMSHSKIIKGETWKFDDNVASRFQEEANSNIPDYHRVIEMCQQIADSKFGKHSVIVDVGSALGYTVESFLTKGYDNVYGVESSEAMMSNSLHRDRIIFSESFPIMPVDFVMANWTLHFVNERKKYIQDVYDNLNSGGVFVLTDKTPQSDIIKEMYYDFKRSHGVTDEYIYEKEKKLQGYMNLLPVQWYLDTLKEVGFSDIQIVNSKYGFVTFYCEKNYA